MRLPASKRSPTRSSCDRRRRHQARPAEIGRQSRPALGRNAACRMIAALSSGLAVDLRSGLCQHLLRGVELPQGRRSSSGIGPPDFGRSNAFRGSGQRASAKAGRVMSVTTHHRTRHVPILDDGRVSGSQSIRGWADLLNWMWILAGRPPWGATETIISTPILRSQGLVRPDRRTVVIWISLLEAR